MVFESFYLSCLSHASYLVGDGGEAAVVDPQRDVDEYLAAAQARGLTIRYVLETPRYRSLEGVPPKPTPSKGFC